MRKIILACSLLVLQVSPLSAFSADILPSVGDGTRIDRPRVPENLGDAIETIQVVQEISEPAKLNDIFGVYNATFLDSEKAVSHGELSLFPIPANSAASVSGYSIAGLINAKTELPAVVLGFLVTEDEEGVTKKYPTFVGMYVSVAGAGQYQASVDIKAGRMTLLREGVWIDFLSATLGTWVGIETSDSIRATEDLGDKYEQFVTLVEQLGGFPEGEAFSVDALRTQANSVVQPGDVCTTN